MATDGNLLREGGNLIAGVDLSAAQFKAVKMSTATDRCVILANTGGEAIYGILQNKPTLGLAADVGFLGVSKAAIGATVTVGQRLMTDTNAKLIPATATNHAIARAIEGGATDTIISVEVIDLGTIA